MTAPLVFDRQQIRRQRNRAAPHLATHDFLLDNAAANIIDRLSIIQRPLPDLVITGARLKPDLVRAMQTAARAERVYLLDIAGKALRCHPGTMRVQADVELWPFAHQSLDAIVSVFDLHTCNDLPGALVQMQRALKPDGVLLGALPGGETLYQLRECLALAETETTGGLSPRIAPTIDKQQMGALLQRTGFALPVVDSDIVQVDYRSFTRLLHDLRYMGEGNAVAARSRAASARKLFRVAGEHYAARHANDDTTLRASFEIIHLIGWSPHASQQKPLRPGSAKTPLAAALGSEETKL